MDPLEQEYAQQRNAVRNRPGTAVTSTMTGGVVRAPQATTPRAAPPDFLTALTTKVGQVAGQTANIAGEVGGEIGNYFKDQAVSAYTGLTSLIDLPAVQLRSKMETDATTALNNKESEIVASYKRGDMSKENYSKALGELTKGYQSVSNDASDLSSGPTPEQRAMGVVDLGVDLLSLGRFKLGGAPTAATGLLTKGAASLEQAITKIPAVRDIVTRNAAQLVKNQAQQAIGETAGQFVMRNSKHIASALLLKKPLFYDLNIGGAQEVYNQIMENHPDQALGSSAWLATQMLSGGPIGAFFKGFKWLGNKIGDLSYGTGSFIDEISKKIGDKNSNQIAKFLTDMKTKDPAGFKDAEKTFRILQETNLRAASNDARLAAENVITHFVQNGGKLEDITPEMVYRTMKNWAEADNLLTSAVKSGELNLKPGDVRKYAVGRLDVSLKKGLAEAVRQAGGTPQQQMEAVSNFLDRPGVAAGNNELFVRKVGDIVFNSKSPEEAAKAIEKIPAASVRLKDVPEELSKKLEKLGFTIIKPFGGRQTPIVNSLEESRRLVSAASDGDKEVFDLATAPQPQLAQIAGVLEKAGLSPRAANEVANRKLAESLVSTLDHGVAERFGFTKMNGDAVSGGRAILSKLQQYVETKQAALKLGRSAAITDIRQLTKKEIVEALGKGTTIDDAKGIQRAIMQGYMDVPLEFRGLGDRVVDTLYKYNPLHKYYSRIQSALRYTYNPFFRTQESIETSILSRAQASNLIWNKSRAELNAGVQVLDHSGIFSSSLPGEAAGENIIGRISANLTQGQKRNLAGLASRMAENKGMTLEQLVAEHPEEIEDALRVIVQYPRHGLIASPLARTLNIAFFPMRYNAKVTALAAKIISRQPHSVQLATLNSIFQFKEWLKSDEGIRWQSQNADAIQVFNWLTPAGNIESAMKLLSGDDQSISDLGSLGGLPLGVITQMLDSQGIIHLNTPYVEPHNGEVLPNYIPQSVKARAAVALGDLLGSMFTYPGRTLGLPGKAATIRNIVKEFVSTNGEDFDKRIDMDRLTPLQKRYVEVLKGDTSDEAIDRLYQSPLPGGFNGYTIPPLDLPVRPLVEPLNVPNKRTGLPTGKSGKKQKNYAQPIPAR